MQFAEVQCESSAQAEPALFPWHLPFVQLLVQQCESSVHAAPTGEPDPEHEEGELVHAGQAPSGALQARPMTHDLQASLKPLQIDSHRSSGPADGLHAITFLQTSVQLVVPPEVDPDVDASPFPLLFPVVSVDELHATTRPVETKNQTKYFMRSSFPSMTPKLACCNARGRKFRRQPWFQDSLSAGCSILRPS